MTTNAISLASAAQAAAAAASAANASSTGTTATAVGNLALQQLGGNFNDFLNLLLTQLQNQDPTSPMDTDQFTTELVQFTGVQQEVATNSSLTALIGLNQQQQILDSAQFVGHQATVTSNSIALQNGTGEISFTGTAGETVGIAILNAAGSPVRNATVLATTGTNDWTWDGKDDQGNQLADGAYRIAAVTQDSSGNTSSVPFDVIGTATGVSNTGSGVTLQMGALSVGLGSLQSIAQ